MLTFAVVASSAGALDLDRLKWALDAPEVPIASAETVLWNNDSKTVAFVGRQTKPPLAQMQSHWHLHEAGITAFSGHLWSRTRPLEVKEPLAAQLYQWRLQGCGPQDLFGIFAVADLRSKSECSLFTDEFGAGLLYRATIEGATIISNRAALAARLVTGAGARPPRDPLGVGWLCFFNHVLDDSTSYRGVTAFRPGELLSIGAGGEVKISRASATSWPRYLGPQSEDLASQTYDDLAGALRHLAAMDASERRIALSGGKDSRLITSIVLAESLEGRFLFETNGDASDPDVIVASRIAQRFGLQHRVKRPSAQIPSADEYFEAVRLHAHLTSGMLGAAYLRGGVKRLANEIAVGGLFGELMRSHHAKDRTISDLHDLDWWVANELPFDPAGILRPDVRTQYLGRVRSWVAEQLDAGVAPADVPDAFYAEHRITRWVGTINEFHRGLLVQPLQSMNALRWAAAAGAEKRKRDSLHFELMRRASPPITKFPFAEDGWHPDNYKSQPDAGDYAAIEPCVATGPPRPRGSTWPVVQSCLRDYLLTNREHPVFDVVDYKRVAATLNAPGKVSATARVSLYNLLGIAVWLSRDEKVAPFNDEHRKAVKQSEILRQHQTRKNAQQRISSEGPRPLFSPGAVRYLKRRVSMTLPVRYLARTIRRWTR